MPDRVVSYEPYGQMRPIINPLFTHFCLFLNRVDQEVDEINKFSPIDEEKDDEKEVLMSRGVSQETFRLIKSIIIEYTKLKKKACRKVGYVAKFSAEEKDKFDQDLSKLEYYGSCIIHFKKFAGIKVVQYHPIVQMKIPVSVWSRARLKYLIYKLNTRKVILEGRIAVFTRP